MPFYQGDRSLRSMAHARPRTARMGLLSDELWPVPQFVSAGAGAARTRTSSRRRRPLDTDDEATGLPNSVINLYRERLDKEGQAYLARGPRTFEEQLAYAQQVRPNAYENSTPASAEDQLRFRQWRDIDWANNFVGPDGIVYVRDRWMGEEKPEARIFRGYETAVGGFKRPRLDDLLERFDLPTPLEGLDPETRAKVEDVQSFDPPASADQAAWRAWAEEQGVNPDTWSLGRRMPDSDQTGYWLHDSRDVAPVVRGSVFVGPDGYLYRHNDLTRPDYSAKVGAALEHQRAVAALRDAPPPTFSELYDQAFASGALFPGTNYSRPLPPAFRGQAVPGVLLQQVPTRQGSGGRRGNADTRNDLQQQIKRLLVLNPEQRHMYGSRNQKGEELPEQYIPNPAGVLLGDGRKKSFRPDSTLMDQYGNLSLIEHVDVTRFGKPTRREDKKAQDEFRWTHTNGYKEVVAPGVYRDLPRVNVYMIPKRHQLERFEKRRNKTLRNRRPKADKKDKQDR